MEGQWGIPLRLQTEQQALRTAKKEGGHHPGLQPSVAAKLSSGASETQARQHLMLAMARIELDEGEKDVGCDHKGEQPMELRNEKSSSTQQAANGHAARQRTQQQPQQQQPPIVHSSAAPSVCSSSAFERSSAGGPGWSLCWWKCVLAWSQRWLQPI
jgi:hypothetical protein